jgi:hypothetical protein
MQNIIWLIKIQSIIQQSSNGLISHLELTGKKKIFSTRKQVELMPIVLLKLLMLLVNQEKMKLIKYHGKLLKRQKIKLLLMPNMLLK